MTQAAASLRLPSKLAVCGCSGQNNSNSLPSLKRSLPLALLLRKVALLNSCSFCAPLERRSRGKKKHLFLCAMEVDALSSAPALQPGLDSPILINGFTGKMGQAIAKAAIEAGVTIVPLALTGPGLPSQQQELEDGSLVEVHPAEGRDEVLDRVLEKYPHVIAVDYTLPAAVNDNVEWYCRRGLPFVMGTTGGDRLKLKETVLSSSNYAVVSPQTGKQLVALLAAFQWLASTCPGAFQGYTLEVVESHQSWKVDASGTAKEFLQLFQQLGVVCSMDQIEMVRDPQASMQKMNVPEEYLDAHAFHTYTLLSPDKTVSFQVQHNVCGRSIYAQGAIDAVRFLAKKVDERSEQRLFSMVDVLKAGSMR
eukprot:TRINITY_DN4522_c0_g1_i1.p1 TRINITY_DN4522_c0_g1~~TRINITY_DN4522_c0_g1_i1.p1  ORF type:complete len:365 (+),score=90.06 TRINITY_DN4522_c0_g1_i1:160-1254(+)